VLHSRTTFHILLIQTTVLAHIGLHRCMKGQNLTTSTFYSLLTLCSVFHMGRLLVRIC